MAELQFLKGDTETATAYWNECKELIFLLFIDGTRVLGKNASPHFLRRIQGLLKRLTRFMFCLNSEFINKVSVLQGELTSRKNITVIDAYLNMQFNVEEAYRRSIHQSWPDPTESEGATTPQDRAKKLSETSTAVSRSNLQPSIKVDTLWALSASSTISCLAFVALFTLSQLGRRCQCYPHY